MADEHPPSRPQRDHPAEPGSPPRPEDTAEFPAAAAAPDRALGPGRAGPSAPRWQESFEQGLSLAKLAVLLPVVVLLITGIGAFVYGVVILIHSVGEISGHPFEANNLRLFLTEIDLFLIGATLMIAGFGLYELFIRRIDPAHSTRPLPTWLQMDDLNDLKARVISMIVLVAAVSFVDVLLEFGNALDVLYLGGGVGLLIAALTLYLRFGSETKG